MVKIVVCNVCGRKYEDQESIDMTERWIREYGDAPCPIIQCPGQLEVKESQDLSGIPKKGGMKMARVIINYQCGCLFRTTNLEAATKHSDTKYHTMDIMGSIISDERRPPKQVRQVASRDTQSIRPPATELSHEETDTFASMRKKLTKKQIIKKYRYEWIQ